MMTIRLATINDLDILVPLFDGYRVFYKQETDENGAGDFLKAHFDSGFSVIFLAEEGGRGLGFTQLYPTFSSVTMEKYYILNDLFVLPAARGKKIGRKLLDKAKHFTIENGYKGLSLATATDNPAQKLYERMGWKKEDEFYHYFWTNKN